MSVGSFYRRGTRIWSGNDKGIKRREWVVGNTETEKKCRNRKVNVRRSCVDPQTIIDP